jgi:hypothetical protein
MTKTITLITNKVVSETALKVYAVIMSGVFLIQFIRIIYGITIDPSMVDAASFGYAD